MKSNLDVKMTLCLERIFKEIGKMSNVKTMIVFGFVTLSVLGISFAPYLEGILRVILGG